MSNVSQQSSDLMLRGSVIKVRRTCGKANCKCTRGEPHETWALSYRQQGRSRMIPLRPEDLTIARQGAKRYRQAFNRLKKQALRDIKRLHTAIKTAKRRAR